MDSTSHWENGMSMQRAERIDGEPFGNSSHIEENQDI